MSDRPAPKFQVGEEVVIVGSRGEHFFGEAVVQAIDWGEGTTEPNFYTNWYEGWVYVVSPNPRDNGKPWTERALRKKHLPSTQSFAELLQSIQQPNKVKA